MERQVTKETLIGDLLQMEPETAQFLIQMGMHCLGCPASRAESLEEACICLLYTSPGHPFLFLGDRDVAILWVPYYNKHKCLGQSCI